MGIIVDNTQRKSGRFVTGNYYSPATQFKAGKHAAPATEFQPGEHRSPHTEFHRGQDAHNWLPVGTVRIRIETHTRLLRAWVKVEEPNVWKKRAVVIWEAAHGALPAGCVVHHRDRDSLNDSPTNLQGMTKAEHKTEHHEEMLRARIDSR